MKRTLLDYFVPSSVVCLFLSRLPDLMASTSITTMVDDGMEPNKDELLEEYHDAIDIILTADNSSNKEEVTRITQSFTRSGLKLRYGRWTFQEKKKLHENFEAFIKENEEEIGNPVDFLTASDDKCRAAEVKVLKRDLGFYRCLCTGLYRERSTVSTHAFFTLDPLAVSNGQPYTVEDLHLLKSLVDKHGRRWKVISKEMGRSVVSLQSAHRNFFLHDGYTRLPPTKKQQRKLLKEMQNKFPEVDFTCQAANDVPWNEIANKIGYLHGKYLCSFWESKLKYRDEEGKLRLKQPVRPPAELVRKFVKHVAKQEPTHSDALDWPFYLKMFAGYMPGLISLKGLIPSLLNRYKIDRSQVPFPQAVKKLHKYMKRQKKLGFQSVWEEIKDKSITAVRWQNFHWALSPDLAHYVHTSSVMYRGFGEEVGDGDRIGEEVGEGDRIKEEPMDIVW